MQSIAELDLPYLAVDDPNFWADPFTPFQAAWRQHPWLAKSPNGYMVTEYAAMKELLSMDDRLLFAQDEFIDFYGARGSRWGNFQEEGLIALTGERHQRIRDVLAAAFTPRAANEQRGLMRSVISRQLDEWAPKGAFDFEEFASFFPITVMCGLIGADPKVIPELRSSLEALGLAFNMVPGFLPKLESAMEVMEGYLEKLVAERRAGHRPNAQPDLLDAILAARDTGGLDDKEMNMVLIFLFVAGYDTSKNLLTLIMETLLTRPEIYERCAEDRDYCHKVLEESLRYKSPTAVFRTTSEDLEYRGVMMPKGTFLIFNLNVATRDPTAVPEPDTFDPDRRQENRHMAFGRGMHICLGQYIARAQTEEGLHLIAQRLRNPKISGTYGYRPFPGVWGLRGLPITFTPAPAREAVPA
jgi:cytochrome P450